METKICTKCKRELPISCFSARSRNSNTYESYCKECKATAQRERAKRYSEERKEQRREYKKEWLKNNHQKIIDHRHRQEELWHRKAHRKVRSYKRKYNISFNVCSMCWMEWRMLTHHPNYDEPTKIIVVCDSCHQAIHRWRLKEDDTKIIDLRELDCHAKAKSHQVKSPR